jgi:hypothetical protein
LLAGSSSGSPCITGLIGIKVGTRVSTAAMVLRAKPVQMLVMTLTCEV